MEKSDINMLPSENRKVTFEVDRKALFDQLKEMGGDTYQLGMRLVDCLFNNPPPTTSIGLALYGVTFSEVPPEAPKGASADRDPNDFHWIDEVVKVTGGDYEYYGRCLLSFPKGPCGPKRFIVMDENSRLFIHNAKQLGAASEDGMVIFYPESLFITSENRSALFDEYETLMWCRTALTKAQTQRIKFLREHLSR